MTTVENMIVEGDSIRLEPMQERFVTDRYAAWLRDPEVVRWMQSGDQTLEQLQEYVRVRTNNPLIRFWAVVDRQTGTHIGNVKLEPINWDKSEAVFGIMIGDKGWWGKGVGTEVTRLVAKHAFRTLGLQVIELGVHRENAAAVRAYQRVGFAVQSVEELIDGSACGSTAKLHMTLSAHAFSEK